jgi:hypothetical protein
MSNPLTDISHNQRRAVLQPSKRSSIRNLKLSPYSRFPGGGSPARKTQPINCPPQHFMESTASSMNSRAPTVTSKFPHGAATPNSLPKDSTKGWVSTAAQRVGLTRANTDGHTPKGASEQARVPGKTDSSNTVNFSGPRKVFILTDCPSRPQQQPAEQLP